VVETVLMTELPSRFQQRTLPLRLDLIIVIAPIGIPFSALPGRFYRAAMSVNVRH
jgi:hypothetical protein